jgi:hypothetical protein
MVWLLINKVLQTMIKINYKACRERGREREEERFLKWVFIIYQIKVCACNTNNTTITKKDQSYNQKQNFFGV